MVDDDRGTCSEERASFVRRAILDVLLKKERDLDALARIAGKAEPTLSNIHMRELFSQKLVEALSTRPTGAEGSTASARSASEARASRSTLGKAVANYVGPQPARPRHSPP